MGAWELTIVVLYALLVNAWKGLHVLFSFYKPRRYFLEPSSRGRAKTVTPLVSIILPAKDEEANVGACVRSILRSEYRNFELIVVDDRSTDGTSEEAARAAAGDARVKILRVSELPVGWTGKMNAVRQALTLARGELVLITDADTQHAPKALDTAVRFQHHPRPGRRIALLSLLPRLENRTLFGKVVQPLVSALPVIWKPLPWVNSRKRAHVALAWGGFLLIRRDALDAIGGIEAVKDRFAADIALAQLVKQSGRRVRVFHGPELVRSYMYTSTRDMINGWSRIVRATAENRSGLLAGTLVALLVGCLPGFAAAGWGLVELLGGTRRLLPLTLGGMGLVHLVLQTAFFVRLYRTSGSSTRYAAFHPAALATIGYLLVLSMIRMRRQQIVWKGTSYRLTTAGRAC